MDSRILPYAAWMDGDAVHFIIEYWRRTRFDDRGIMNPIKTMNPVLYLLNLCRFCRCMVMSVGIWI